MIKKSSSTNKRFNFQVRPKKSLQKPLNNSHHSSQIHSDYQLALKQEQIELQHLNMQLNNLRKSRNFNKNTEAQIQSQIALKKKNISDYEKLIKLSSANASSKNKNIVFSAKTIRMGLFYKIKSLWMKIFLVAIIGCISSIIIWLFVQYTGLYSPGVSGVIQGLAKIVRIVLGNQGTSEHIITLVYNLMFWILYFVINIPLLIFAYFKIGKLFSGLTIIYIACSQLVGFGLSFINHGQGIFIFTNMNMIDSSAVPMFVQGVQLIPWNAPNGIVVGLFVYGLVYAVVNGASISIIYILGSSTGGTDVFGFYYAKVKNKQIGTLLTYFNVGSLILGVTLGSFACWMLEANESVKSANTILEAFFSPNLIASILATSISGLIYNYFFPKNKIIKVQMYSQKCEAVALSLANKDWNYKVLLSNDKSDTLSGFNNQNSLETVCRYLDLPILISNLREVDQQGLITIYSIHGVDGSLPTNSFER